MADPKKSSSSATESDGLSEEERQAIKDRAKELRTAKRRGGGAAKGAAADAQSVLDKIAEMEEPDRGMAEGVHAVITAAATELTPKLWYGMPAYAKDGKVVCFFQPALKFKARYSTLGFNDPANLDDGAMWPTAFALTKLTKAAEAEIAALVKRAAS